MQLSHLKPGSPYSFEVTKSSGPYGQELAVDRYHSFGVCMIVIKDCEILFAVWKEVARGGWELGASEQKPHYYWIQMVSMW